MLDQIAQPTGATPPRWKVALDEANRVRLVRAAWKRRLMDQPTPAASMALAATVLEDVPEDLASMELVDLLSSCRRVGDRMAERYAEAVDVSPRRPLGALTSRQRWMLAGALRVPRHG